MNIKEQIEQRLKDLKGVGLLGDAEKRAQLIEATAANMVIEDLLRAADIAQAVAWRAHADEVTEPTINDVLAINQLYLTYLSPACSVLLARGELPQPPVMTTPAGHAVSTKADLAS